jgi:UDP-N-acetylmuramoyl-L-alanyl-D-glutamate--2,6-diaminopimelate ligase
VCGGPSAEAGQAVAAEKGSDICVLTSDNPRTEDPLSILNDVVAGISAGIDLVVEVDRARAIALGIAAAEPCDLVLIAGKGHETTQEINGVKHPFSDQSHAQQAIHNRSIHV